VEDEFLPLADSRLLAPLALLGPLVSLALLLLLLDASALVVVKVVAAVILLRSFLSLLLLLVSAFFVLRLLLFFLLLSAVFAFVFFDAVAAAGRQQLVSRLRSAVDLHRRRSVLGRRLRVVGVGLGGGLWRAGPRPLRRPLLAIGLAG
jgi:hypothetical protein